jgi:hypothetical protein
MNIKFIQTNYAKFTKKFLNGIYEMSYNYFKSAKWIEKYDKATFCITMSIFVENVNLQ